MKLARRLCLIALALLCGGLATLVRAEEGCRIAYDMGSSGIRAGDGRGQRIVRADIDFLAPLAAGRSLLETTDATVEALNALPLQAGFSPDCIRLGGAFSAWRLALQEGTGQLIPILWRIKAQSGVNVLLIPQAEEGRYGYFAARRVLGDALQTSHVLDIGGGSLQVAGETQSFGVAFGQKTWHQHLCRLLRRQGAPHCDLQRLTTWQLQQARLAARKQLQGVRQLGGTVTMTAISRPVSRGVLPAIGRLTATGRGEASLSLSDLQQSIQQLSRLTTDEAVERTGISPKFLTYLLSDMLLVEALLGLTGQDTLHVLEADLTNLPGLLADERAYRWAGNYACYLNRLQAMGIAAFASDPATCP